MHPTYENVTVRQTLVPAARTTTGNGTAVDLAAGGARYQDAMVVVTTGTITDGTHTIAVQESDNGTDFTAVADEDLQGTEPAIVAADDDKTFVIGYLGRARYLRASVTVGSATTGGVYGVAIVLASPRRLPVSHS